MTTQMTSMIVTPDRTEAAEYYFTYIAKVGPGDILEILETQLPETVAFFRAVSEERSRWRYAPDKWSIRQVLSHINDAERLFAFRALWFARGLDSPLPSFDQEVAEASTRADERSWSGLIEEFGAVRAATIALFEHLPAEAWMRRGVASGNPVSVRALAYIIAGHVTHHTSTLRSRYLQG
jgi:hypothetical protein